MERKTVLTPLDIYKLLEKITVSVACCQVVWPLRQLLLEGRKIE